MKKIYSLLLASILCLTATVGLFGCNSDPAPTVSTPAESAAPSQNPNPTEEVENTEKIGITKLKTFVDTPVENPAAEVVVGDITYQLNEEGNGYVAFLPKQTEYEKTQKIARSVNGLPVVDCSIFANHKWNSLPVEIGFVDPSYYEIWSFDNVYLPDTAQRLDIGFCGTHLWVPQSVLSAIPSSYIDYDRLNFARTNCPVYFPLSWQNYWSGMHDSVMVGTEEKEGFFFAEMFNASPLPFAAALHYCPMQKENGVVVGSAGANHYGLGGIFQASCLRFYDENGNVQYEIPFANQQSEIVQVTEKENWYRTEVKESDLPAGDWYYISDSGEWKKFFFGQIDYTRQQIVALYPFAATEG